MLNNLLLVGLGGFAGSIARYLVYLALEEKSYPLATFAVNMAGSLILGIFIGYSLGKGLESNTYRLLFAVGFCGSFTTFSTFALENFQFLQDRGYMQMITYSLGSVMLGLLLAWLGVLIGRAI